MKPIIALIVLLPSICLGGPADDLAKRVISTLSATFDNALPGALRQKADADKAGLTVDELEERDWTRAMGSNAPFDLKHYMLSDEVTEDIRLCYAITILDTRINYASVLSETEPEAKALRKRLLSQKQTLAKRRLEIRRASEKKE